MSSSKALQHDDATFSVTRFVWRSTVGDVLALGWISARHVCQALEWAWNTIGASI